MMKFTCADEVVAQIEQRKNRGYGLEHFKPMEKDLPPTISAVCCKKQDIRLAVLLPPI